MAGAWISFKGMVACAALLGAFLLFGGPHAHASGCSQAPGCPYLEASVVGQVPPVGQGVFRFPQAVAATPGGAFVFVADQYSGVVRKFDNGGNWVSDLGWFADKGQLGRLGAVGGLATDRRNHLYVLDSQHHRVQVFRSDTGAWIGAWGSRGAADGQFDLGAGPGAGGIAVHQPTAADPPQVFIADHNNHRVQRFTLDRFSSSDGSGPVLPAGSAAPGEPNHVPTPTPDVVWGSFGDCSAHGCNGAGDRSHLNFPQGIATYPAPDGSGQVRVLVADTLNHRVVAYSTAGAYEGELGGLGSAAGQLSSPLDVAVDSAGSLYVADQGNHRVQRFDALDLGFRGEWGGLGTAPGNLEAPRALGAPADGHGVYVADSGNQRIQRFDSAGSATAAWGTIGRGGPGYVTRPGGLAVDRAGTIYVGDTWAHRIERLSPAGAYLGQWGRVVARTGLVAQGSGNAQFHFPRGVAFDPAGNIWVADQNNHRVQVLTTAGAWLASYGGPAAGSGLGEFNLPRAAAVGPGGELYVADSGNNRIQRRDPSGSWSVVSVGAQLDSPASVAVDGSGTLFVADRSRVLRVDGNGATPLTPPGASFDRPGGLWVTGNRLFVSDTGNSRVLRLDRPTGAWTEIGGEGAAVGSFVAPTELSTTVDGRTLYVADQHNNRIQRFLLDLPAVPPRSSGRQAGNGGAPAARPPDKTKPMLRLRARLRQRVLKRRAVLVSINCNEPCLADARGKVKLGHGRRALPLRRVRRQLEPGARVRIRLRLRKRARRQLRRALARRWRVTARVVVKGRDLAGNDVRDARRILVRR